MKSIIFCGDTAMPFDVHIDISEIKPIFEGKQAIVNLEGAILPNEKELKNYKWNDKYSVYSQPEVLYVCKELNVKFASLCNNHILDYKYPIAKTEERLIAEGITPFGLKNHDVVKGELNGKPLYVVTFATCANDHALNLYGPDKVVEEIGKLKREEDCLVVVYPHWGVERLKYVDPIDRKHAHRMIDAGADLIVGHHPHIIQQVELYKGKTIIYSLGNFLFPQTYYGDKKLLFDNPEIQDELVVEWDGEQVRYHALHYDPKTDKIHILRDTERYITELRAEVTDPEYTRLFKTKVSKVEFYIKRRLKDSDSGEKWCYRRRTVFRIIRKMMIKLGVHKPK